VLALALVSVAAAISAPQSSASPPRVSAPDVSATGSVTVTVPGTSGPPGEPSSTGFVNSGVVVQSDSVLTIGCTGTLSFSFFYGYDNAIACT